MKKQLLVVMPGSLELGGVERSLLGLLDSIDYEKYNVDLFLYGHHGALFEAINSNVNILEEVRELAYLRESFVAKLKHGCFYSAALRLRDAIKSRFTKVSVDYTWREVMRFAAKPIEKKYDMALSFFLPFDYISEMADASVKVGWIHTDYSTEINDLTFLREQYSKVDVIVAVSKTCGDSFCKVLPEYKEKVVIMENIISSVAIEKGAGQVSDLSDMPDDGSLRILSVGRYCTAKNFDNVPDICKRILDTGLNVKWYIIGFGGDEALIRSKIKEFGMEDRVILLGKKENPYPYMANCDLYAQLSRYEGKCVSVREAQILGKPVVITNYATSSSQLKDGFDGVIVSMDNESCAKGIADLLRDSAKMEMLSKNCLSSDYSGREEVEKLYKLMEN